MYTGRSLFAIGRRKSLWIAGANHALREFFSPVEYEARRAKWYGGRVNLYS